MVEKTPWLDKLTIVSIILGVIIIGFPIYYTLIASTLNLEQVSTVPMQLYPGTDFIANAKVAWQRGDLTNQLINTFIMALGITVGKIVISMLSAYAIVYFDFKLRMISFWMIFMTLMLPVEVRILPTYEVAANVMSPVVKFFGLFNVSVNVEWSLLNSFPGLILPLIASATATFLFRQFFLTIPDELCEAAKMDGATPMQFFWKILFPLSKTNIAALFVIVFVYGWNQFLWPLLITTDNSMKTAIIGIQELIPKADELPEWNVAMAGALFVMIPPILVVIFMQKWFVKGLVENEK